MAPPENPPFDFDTDESIAHTDIPTADDRESLPGDAAASVDWLTQLNGPSAVRGAIGQDEAGADTIGFLPS